MVPLAPPPFHLLCIQIEWFYNSVIRMLHLLWVFKLRLHSLNFQSAEQHRRGLFLENFPSLFCFCFCIKCVSWLEKIFCFGCVKNVAALKKMKKVKQNLHKIHYRDFSPFRLGFLRGERLQREPLHKYLSSPVGKTDNSSW